MNLGMPLPEFAAEITRQSETKRDFIASTAAISMMLEQTPLDAAINAGPINLDGIIAQSTGQTDREMPLTATQKLLLNMGQLGNFPIRELCHSQIATYCGIPLPYYNRMRAELPDLLLNNVNAWFQKKGDRRLIRTLDGHARALLGERYRPLDNVDAVQAALPPLMEAGAKIVSQSITETRMYIKALSPRLMFEIKPGDTVQAGILIQNSEVGHSNISVFPFTVRLVCSNGAVHEDFGLKRRHVGKRANPTGDGEVPEEWLRDETRQADDKAFFMKFQDVVRGSFDEAKFAALADKMRESTTRKMEADPLKVVEVTAKRFLFNDGERTDIMKNLLTGNDLTQWGLAQAVTQMAGSVGDYDRSTDAERIGATIIELPKTDWEALLREASTTKAAA